MLNSTLDKMSYLVVDDFGDMRLMVRSMLSMFGVTDIDTARDGAEAIEKMEEKRYDIVLCDYNLGKGRNGQHVLEEARHRNLIGVGTTYVMITAENTREMVMSAFEYEPDSYLSKPFTKDRLRTRLEKVVQRKLDLKPVEQALDKKDFAKAIQLLDERIAKKPKYLPDLIRLKGDICIRAGAYDKAEKIYQNVLSSRELPWAQIGLGRVYYEKEQYEEAKKIFEHAIASNEGLVVAHDWLSKTLMALGKEKEAQKVLAEAVALSPLAIIRQKTLGDIAMANGDFSAAEQAFNKTVALGRHSIHKHPRNYSRLVESKLNGDNPKSAIEAMKIVEQMERVFKKDDTASLYASLTKAAVHKKTGNDDAAVAQLQKAEQLLEKTKDSDPHAVLSMAKAHASLGNEERAHNLIKAAVKNNHDDKEFLSNVHSTCKESGIASAASNIIASAQKEIVDLNNRGVKMVEKGQLEEAISLFVRAAEGLTGNKTINLNATKVLLIHMKRFGVDKESLSKVRTYMARVKAVDASLPGLAAAQAQLDQLLKSSSSV